MKWFGLAVAATMSVAPPSWAIQLGGSANYGSEVPNKSDAATSHGGFVSVATSLSNGSISATSSSAYGLLGVSTFVTGDDSGGPILGSGGIDRRGANAVAYFEDRLTILAGAPGQAGVATFALHLKATGGISSLASHSASPATEAAVKFGVSNGGASDGLSIITSQIQKNINTVFDPIFQLSRVGTISTYSGHVLSTFTPTGLDEFNGLYTVSVAFISGTPITVDASATCTAGAPTDTHYATASAFCDLTNGLAWGGFTSVVDSQGAAIAASTASDSGFNYGGYALDAPEPAGWALMILGFGMIGFAARRRAYARTSQAAA